MSYTRMPAKTRGNRSFKGSFASGQSAERKRQTKLRRQAEAKRSRYLQAEIAKLEADPNYTPREYNAETTIVLTDA